MDELSPLFQEIEFHERFRGYDPDEVDAYVDRVARAAAVLRGRLVELHERVDAAEARGRGSQAATETEETLTRTLVLAQRTADAAIAEAREEADRMTTDAAASAQSILTAAESEAQITLREAQVEASAALKDAEDRSTLMLAEAETDRRSIVAEAATVAADAAVAERTRLVDEVSELRDYREFLADDIEILERYVTDERHQLAASLSALTDLLESPEAFRSRPVPETSDPESPAALVETVASDSELVATALAEAAFAETEFAETEFAETEFVAAGAAGDASDLDKPEETVDEVLDSVDAMLEGASVHSAAAASVEVSEATEELTEPASVEEWAATIDLSDDDGATESELEPEPIVSTFDDRPVDDEEALVSDDVLAFEPEPEPLIDLVAGPASDSESEVAYEDGSTYVESSFSEAPFNDSSFNDSSFTNSSFSDTVTEAPRRLVTAADLETPAVAVAKIGLEPSLLIDPGPATEQMPLIDEIEVIADADSTEEEDPFLSQLRDVVDRARVKEVQNDEALSAFFDQEDDDGSRSWFGRRR